MLQTSHMASEPGKTDLRGLFVCGISLTSGQVITELFPDCLKVMLFALYFYVAGVVTVSMR